MINEEQHNHFWKKMREYGQRGGEFGRTWSLHLSLRHLADPIRWMGNKYIDNLQWCYHRYVEEKV